jgi:hypothetical protein
MRSSRRAFVLACLSVGIVATSQASSCVDFPDVVPGDGDGGTTQTATTSTSSGGGTSTNTGGMMGTGGVLQGGGGSGSGGSPPTACTAADEFEGADVASCWNTLAGRVDVDVTGGELVLTPNMAGTQYAWYNATTAYFLGRDVSGTFAVATRLNASQIGDPNLPPNPNPGSYHMAGLFLRDASAAQEKWVKLEIGYREMGGTFAVPVGFLAARTVDGTSAQLRPYLTQQVHEAWLGICRHDDVVQLWVRTEAQQPWQQHLDTQAGSLADLAPLPTTLQVGVIAGAYTGPPPSVQGNFEYVRFAEGQQVVDNGCTETLTNLVDAGPQAGCDCD